MAELLMPKATAVWLVDNTSLSFDQIAEFCKLHPLEVRAIADGEAAQGIKGLDPISTGQLTRDQLEKAQSDPNFKLKLQESRIKIPAAKRKRPRYTPVSKRQDRPNAIRWLTRNHPELKDSQIIRLVGTTKNTIEAIREGTHWNAANLTPMDPVTLGLCTQIALDFEVQKANKNRPVEEQNAPVPAEPGDQLIPASETQALAEAQAAEAVEQSGEAVDAASVFSDFGNLNKPKAAEEDSASGEAGSNVATGDTAPGDTGTGDTGTDDTGTGEAEAGDAETDVEGTGGDEAASGGEDKA